MKTTNETFPVKEKNKVESRTEKGNFPVSFNARTKKIESELEVFTSASLVNLVKLMHPYCLRLHVNDEGAKLRKNHTFFSQEEVWRYERPTEGSDEEINVVSDDEAPVKEAENPERRADSGKLLKSALLKSKSSKERKRVSFGPVEVASFDETLTSSHTGEATPALGNSPTCLPEMTGNEGEITAPKSPTKTKALSLQQYRQLRQQRQPLVEKQRNYTTKWPSVPEAPQELTPILSSQGQKLSTGRQKSSQTSGAAVQKSATPGHVSHSASARPCPSEANPYTPAKYRKVKHPRTESKAPPSPAQPLAGATVDGLLAPEGKVSPVKRAAAVIISSDPPNPILLTVPLSQTSSACKDQTSSKSKEDLSPAELQPRLSGTSVERSPAIEDAVASTQDANSCMTVVALQSSTTTHFNSSVPYEQVAKVLHAKSPRERLLPSPAVSGKSST